MDDDPVELDEMLSSMAESLMEGQDFYKGNNNNTCCSNLI